MVSEGKLPLIIPLGSLLRNQQMAIIFGINLNFSQAGGEDLWAEVSQGTRGERGEVGEGD